MRAPITRAVLACSCCVTIALVCCIALPVVLTGDKHDDHASEMITHEAIRDNGVFADDAKYWLHQLRMLHAAHGEIMRGTLVIVKAASRRSKRNAVKLVNLGGGRSNKVVRSIARTAQHVRFSGYCVMHVGAMDDDVVSISRRDGAHRILSVVDDIASRGASVWFLHASPSVDAKGRLPPHTVMIPHVEALTKPPNFSRPLNARKQASIAKPGLAWRGTTTGFARAPADYRMTQRYRFVQTARSLGNSNVDVGFSSRCQGVNADVVPDAWVPGYMQPRDMSARRIVADIDGNTCAWESLRWKLASGSAVLKVGPSPFVQWYYQHLRAGIDVVMWNPDTGVEGLTRAMSFAESHNVGLRRQARSFAERHLSKSAVLRYIATTVQSVMQGTHDAFADVRIRTSRADDAGMVV